ncbi:MAG TPA: PKD domain-containing protein [archaeon]|nr:PKD domain-containing protein [archaeon]
MLSRNYLFFKNFPIRKRKRFYPFVYAVSFFIISSNLVSAEPEVRTPLRTVVDLNLGESKKVELINGDVVTVKLLEINKTTDQLRSAVRAVRVKVAVDGETAELASANYNLPIDLAGIRIDCPVTRDYYKNSDDDRWGLEKDARLRLWPAGSPFIAPGTFQYPLRQRWLASDTHMSNEPCYVDGGEDPSIKEIYYHSGLDFGGSEGLEEVFAATEGTVISFGDSVLSGYEDSPVSPRYDVIYVRDKRGWYYRYSHLKSIEAQIRPGAIVGMGQKIGVLGKEGASGGWSHLHFEIRSRQPSGKWGTEEGYAYIWQAYLERFKPALIAVARPHQVADVGQTVTLDGTKSRGITGSIKEYEWIFTDRSSAPGPVQKRVYQTPGTYTEVLKVVDSNGNIDYDYAVVQVIDKNGPDKLPPSIHANFYPTVDIRPGDPVTFKVRSFNTLSGDETWDFGDGSPRVTVRSNAGYSWYYKRFREMGLDSETVAHDPAGYAETVHSFSKPGDYLVRVERTGDFGYKAVTCLHVPVLERGQK